MRVHLAFLHLRAKKKESHSCEVRLEKEKAGGCVE